MGVLILKQGIWHFCTLVLKAEENFMKKLSALLQFFRGKRQLLKALLTWTFIPSLLRSESRKKIHTEVVIDVPKGARGRIVLFYREKLGRGQQEPILSSKAVPEDLNMKFRLKFNHGFTNRSCLHCAILNLQVKRYTIFPSNRLQ